MSFQELNLWPPSHYSASEHSFCLYIFPPCVVPHQYEDVSLQSAVDTSLTEVAL